jgi:hypothetical protein
LPAKIPIEVYKTLVDQCASRRLNYPIANGSPVHARILIAKLFEIAESEVVIVSGSLTDESEAGLDVYGYEPVIRAAQKFLRDDPNAHLSIILQQGEMHHGNKNRFFRSVVNDTARCGAVTITTPKAGVFDSAMPHFMVADSSSYRIETGTDATDKSERMTAVANFGDAATAGDLRSYFDEVIDFVTSESLGNGKAYGPEARID